ncbi:MAG: hypothetical protein N2444_00340, partial [Methylocystis sp.]|nr:hypothetical protein [Methylocystis sp.]
LLHGAMREPVAAALRHFPRGQGSYGVSFFPSPQLWGGAAMYGFVSGAAGYGAVIGAGFVAASTAPLGFVPGGSLTPGTFAAFEIRAVNTVGVELIIAISGSHPQDLFDSVTVPGVNGGAAIPSSSATLFGFNPATGDTVWRFAITGSATSGTVIFQ